MSLRREAAQAYLLSDATLYEVLDPRLVGDHMPEPGRFLIAWQPVSAGEPLPCARAYCEETKECAVARLWLLVGELDLNPLDVLLFDLDSPTPPIRKSLVVVLDHDGERTTSPEPE